MFGAPPGPGRTTCTRAVLLAFLAANGPTDPAVNYAWQYTLSPRHCHVVERGKLGECGVTTPMPSYKGHRYPVEIINHCVWL